MAKTPLLTPAAVGPSGGPFGSTKPGRLTSLSPFGHGKGRVRAVTTLKRGGKVPRFDFGGLFGGQPGVTTQQTNSAVQSTGATDNNIADPQYNQLRDQTLGTAAGLDFSDPSKYIAGFNQDQQGAFQDVRNNQGSFQPFYNQAQGSFQNASGTAANLVGSSMPYVQQAGQMQTGSEAFNPFAQQADQTANTQVGNYMSPYQQNAMNAVGQASNTAFSAPGGPMERINDTFSGGNAAQFGRERHGDVMGNAVYQQQQALDQSLSQMANTGYQSAMTAAQTDLQRQAGLGATAGQLANAGIQTQAGLGQTAANIGQLGTAANVSAGTAMQGLGTAQQNAGYTDANALLSVGNQQQQLEQQQLSMPLQGLQYQQSLGQGWQLPTNSHFTNTNNSGGSSTTSQTAPQGSIAGQVVGAGTAIAGAIGGDSNTNPDGTKKSARGGQINYFATGGYVPTVTGVRKRNAMRKTPPPPPSPMGPMGGMGGMQPTGMPGMPPPAPPTAAALNPLPQPPQPLPHPANRRLARGGVFNASPFTGDEAQDRAMVERGVHQHERNMHKATTGELTKLRLARGGSVPGYAYGGLEIRGNPTPRFRDNLPPPMDYGDDSTGHEVPPVNPMQWFERGNPRSEGGGSFVPGQWAPLPEPDPRDLNSLNRLHQQHPEWYPQYDMPTMPRGNTPLSPAVARAIVNRGASPSSRRAAVAPRPAEDEPRSGWRAWGYDPVPEPAPDRNFFDRLFSWLGGKGYHAEGGQAGPHGYAQGGGVPGFVGGGMVDLMGGAGVDATDAGGGMGFSPMGYINDAVNLGTEIGGGDQGLTDSPQTPYDPLSSAWDSVYGEPREKYDEGERIGSDVGRPIGRAIGDYFTGGIGSGAFAEGFGRLGGGVGALVQGHFGEGINDLTQGTPLSFIKLARGGGVPGYATGSTVTLAELLAPGMTAAAAAPVAAADRAALDEKASTGPFGTGLKMGAPGTSVAHFGAFGPMAGAGGTGGGGSGGGGGSSSGGDIASMGGSIAKLIPALKGLFGGSGGPTPGTPDAELGITPGAAVGTGTAFPGEYTTGDLDMSSFGGGTGLFAARGGQIPPYASGGLSALDDQAPTGPFGSRLNTGVVNPSIAQYTGFGPLGGLPGPSGPSGGGGGGGSAGSTMGGAGSLLGGLSKMIPFLARGGQLPGYDEGGQRLPGYMYQAGTAPVHDSWAREGSSPFLDASSNAAGYRRQAAQAQFDDDMARRPQAPQYMSPEAQARTDAQSEYERNKGGLRRWGEQVYGDIAKPAGQMADRIGRGDYIDALEPPFAALGSMTPAAGATGMAMRQTAQELRAAQQAWQAAKQGLEWRRAWGR